MADDEILQRVAGNIRAEMARQEKDQRDIAPVLGISQPQVSMRLQGRIAIRVDELQKIADYLDVPVGRFYDEERVA